MHGIPRLNGLAEDMLKYLTGSCPENMIYEDRIHICVARYTTGHFGVLAKIVYRIKEFVLGFIGRSDWEQAVDALAKLCRVNEQKQKKETNQELGLLSDPMLKKHAFEIFHQVPPLFVVGKKTPWHELTLRILIVVNETQIKSIEQIRAIAMRTFTTPELFDKFVSALCPGMPQPLQRMAVGLGTRFFSS